MIEPIAGNMNFVRACVPFMKRLRELCTQHGALLVFDEVMTGFRVALGSAQSVYAKAIPGFKPDITVLGKVIGGGMPLAAFGGTRARHGTAGAAGPGLPGRHAVGNPVATACGLATLREIRKPGFFDALSAQDPLAGRRPDRRGRASRRAVQSATAKAACSASSSPTPCRRTTPP